MAFPDHIMYKGELILRNYPHYRNEQQRHDKAVNRPHYVEAWFKRQVYAN